ncbi:hypothetical protein SprV_0100250500 [Sparganum proliferum]
MSPPRLSERTFTVWKDSENKANLITHNLSVLAFCSKFEGSFAQSISGLQSKNAVKFHSPPALDHLLAEIHAIIGKMSLQEPSSKACRHRNNQAPS